MVNQKLNSALRLWESLIDRILNRSFDLYYRVETRKLLEPEEMDIGKAEAKQAKRYQGSHVRILRKAFRRLNIDFADYHFIDLGCGKGRAMLIASIFGVKKCIGIEISPTLQTICDLNINTFCRRTGADKKAFEVFKGNVLDFRVTTPNNLVYLFNPFNMNVVEGVVKKLKCASLTPEADVILSINPRSDTVLKSVGYDCFQEVANRNPNKTIRFYRLNPGEIAPISGF
jgi:hypothetical protein